MHAHQIPLYLLPFLATTTTAVNHLVPRQIDIPATLIQPSPTSAPYIRHLDLRQVAAPAAAQPAAAQPAAAQPAAAAPAAAAPAAQQQQQQAAAPAVAPLAPNAAPAGVGGGGQPAAAQPTPGATANSVTTITIATVVGGVTQQVPVAYTQTFGDNSAAPAVQTGSIGLGTLTGKVGVVKTNEASSEGVKMGRINHYWQETTVVGFVALIACVGGTVFGFGM